MGGIMSGLERAIKSALKTIVIVAAQGSFESFARHILQAATAGAIQAWPAQRLAVAAAVTDAQTTVLPELARRAEALRGVDVSAEATGTDRADTWRGAHDLDLRQSLGRAQHQHLRFSL